MTLWPDMRTMFTSKPMVYAPWRSSEVVDELALARASLCTRAALIIPAAVIATEWSPIPPRWKGRSPLRGQRVRDADRAQYAAMS